MSGEERKRIRSAFDRAASAYESAAGLQRDIAHALAEWSGLADTTPCWALDAGCGTGFGAAELHRIAANASVLGLDLAPAMAEAFRHKGCRSACGDIEALPFADESIGLYWSSLAWQWCDATRAAAEAARVLRPGGTLLLASLGPDTLKEVRETFAQIDGTEHVRRFETPQHLHAALLKAGFRHVRFARHDRYAWAPDLRSLLDGIRAIGAHTLGSGRRRGLLGRHAWQSLVDHYEQYRSTRGLPARYDVFLIKASR